MGKRTIAIYLTLVLIFTGLLGRVYALSVKGGEELSAAAQSQRSYLLEVDHTRGIIYDKNLSPLVAQKEEVTAAVVPSPEANAALAAAIHEDGEEIVFDPQAEQPYLLTLSEASLYAKNIEMFDTVRRYADNQLAPHIIGYLNPEKTEGAAGIELAYDEQLRQYDGSLELRYTLDAVGRTMTDSAPEIIKTNYKSAGGVVLTLDADIQWAVQQAMRNVEKGAAVVMEADTGNILASVSMPAYNQNDLAASLKDPNSPFVNRAFSQYSVGSTFKVVTAACALEAGHGRYAPYTCQGVIDVSGHPFHCHWRLGHGEIDMNKAIEISCNPFFINLGLEVGGKRIVSMARDLGFGRAAEFTDLIRSQSGTLPGEAELRNPAAVANLSFGQGSLTATPIQVAQMFCAAANGGYAVTPRLVEGFTDDGKSIYEHTTAYAPNRVFSKRTSDTLQEFLVNNMVNGSGELSQPTYTTAGGKTASAQTGIYRTPGEEDSEIVHAWFGGYFPAKSPEYVIVVLVEGGGSGQDVAAPFFKAIADGIYLSKL